MSWEKHEEQAKQMANDKDKIKILLEEADEKAKRNRNPLSKIWKDLSDLLRLLKSFAKGEYKYLPWRSLVMAIAAVLYFISPLDLIPDFLPFGGLADDVTIIGLVAKAIRRDMEDFFVWEEEGFEEVNE